MNLRLQPDFVPLESLSSSLNANSGIYPAQPRYWRNIDEFSGIAPYLKTMHGEGTPVHNHGAMAEEPNEETRRRFLSLMAASMGLAGLTACTRQPTQFIVPYVDPPENAIPGQAQYYATAIPVNGIAQGVLVESHLGRPTKIEGNPDHPASLGATDVLSQAAVLDLYDPDRTKQFSFRGQSRTEEEFLAALRGFVRAFEQNGGRGLHILTETVTSPTLGDRIHAVLKKYPSAVWHQWEPLGGAAAAAAQIEFGRAVNTYYKLDEADIVVALDADFLACSPNSVRYAHDFMKRRRRSGRLDMNRLYAIESCMTSTGGKADHRLAVRHSDVERFARELARAVGLDLGAPPSAAAEPFAYQSFIPSIVQDLISHRGASAVIPGECQPAAVHVLAHRINAALGNTGRTVIYTNPLEAQPANQVDSLGALVGALNAGSVELLFVLGGNPVYNAPADFPLAQSILRAKTSVHLTLHENETSAYCQWVIPESHLLEDWADLRSFDGTVTIAQPLIYPLYRSWSQLHALDALLEPPGRPSYEIVRSYWASHRSASGFEQWWRKAVHDGVVEDTALAQIRPQSTNAPLPPVSTPPPNSLEIVFRPDPYLRDGRYANNAWLMELPRPMTKLTWDNAMHISPRTAKRLGLDTEQLIELQYRGRKVQAPVFVQPGQPDDSVTVDLGFGHTRFGRVGTGAGFDAYQLRFSDALWSASGIQIRKLDKTYPLAATHGHHYMEGRHLVISRPVEEFRGDPDFVAKIQESPSPDETLYPKWKYEGQAWGMAIDLTACVNCNACVVACQAENNIPVVGKDQVRREREMHWLRIDTYYEGDPSYPSAAYYQPLPCMQCENAPCEYVCPVHATVHSAEGLNDMVYNRCVGTRYCSNNCPYKVRRFNFFLYSDWNTETLKMQRNPDVTVRSRGVMEKCNYCVQRIRGAEIRARIENRPIRDGEIKTACQQACPTEAIVFGDINGKATLVSQRKSEKLNYALLAELNTRPRTTYLAELRNPNPQWGKERG